MDQTFSYESKLESRLISGGIFAGQHDSADFKAVKAVLQKRFVSLSSSERDGDGPQSKQISECWVSFQQTKRNGVLGLLTGKYIGISSPVSLELFEQSSWICSSSALLSVHQLAVATAVFWCIRKLPNTVPILSVKEFSVAWRENSFEKLIHFGKAFQFLLWGLDARGNSKHHCSLWYRRNYPSPLVGWDCREFYRWAGSKATRYNLTN